MRMLTLAGLLFAVTAAAAAAVGCGDDDDGGSPAGAAGSPGGATTLDGTWDLFGAFAQREPATGVLQLGSTGFSLVLSDGGVDLDMKSIRFDATAGALIGLDGDDPDDQIAGTREPGESMRLGAWPLPVDGKWALSAPDRPQKSCFTSLLKAGAGIRCQGVEELSDWEGAGALSVEHTAEAPSMFGDLGGTWRASRVLKDSPDSNCELRFEGAEVKLTCQKLRFFTGTLRVTFDGNQASGTIDDKLEFSALRRFR